MKKLLGILLIVIMITSNTVIALDHNRWGKDLYIYRTHGIYKLIYELGASGIYKAQLSRNITDTYRGSLRVLITFEFWLEMFLDKHPYYMYIYKLDSYIIENYGFDKNIIMSLNKTLSMYLNKTIVEINDTVNPSIRLSYNTLLNRFYFTGFSTYYNVSAIALYEDTICFENRIYSENILGNKIYRVLSSIYYDALSYTPLYFYEYHAIIDLYNDNNYIYTKQVIVEDGIGYGLSKISRSKTKLIYHDSSVSKIGFISYVDQLNPNITYRNNTLYIDVNTEYPYRIIMVLSNKDNINETNIDFIKVYRFRTETLYMTPVITDGSLYIVVLNDPIKNIVDQQGNITFIHEITTEEKNYYSTYVIIFTLVFNIVAIIAVYQISKLLLKILSNIY